MLYIAAMLTGLRYAIASAKSRSRICKSPDQDASEGGMARKAVAAIRRERRRHRGSQWQEYLCLPAQGVIGIKERQSYSLDFTGHSGSPKSSCPDYQRNPLAVLASDHVSESLSEHVKDFALRNAPDVGVGIIDAGGFRRFAGHGLEVLNAERSRVIEGPPKEVSPGNLFYCLP
jgi:hypothetical protein